MLLTFLSRTMSSLLTLLLFVTVVGATANHTFLNTHYIESKLESQHAYSRLSDGISREISQNTDNPQSVSADQLKTVLTDDVLREKIDTTLKQLQAYYRGDGPVPTLDISDLIHEAQARGLQIDAEKFDKPVKLTAATKAKKLSDTAKLVSIGTLIVIGLLLAGVLTIAYKRRDFRPLANIAFSLGLMLTIAGAILLFVPSVFGRLYKFDAVTNPLASLARDLAVSTSRDFGLRLLIIGCIILLLGILAKVLLRRRAHRVALTPAVVSEVDTPAAPPIAKPVGIADVPTTPSVKPDTAPGAPPSPSRKPKARKIQL